MAEETIGKHHLPEALWVFSGDIAARFLFFERASTRY